MKLEMTLSERDKKLLLILCALLILAGSYFLVYEKNMSKAAELTASNEQLQVRVDELSQMEAQKEEKVAETGRYKSYIKFVQEQFPAEVRTEDALVMLDELERTADMTIVSVDFKMNQPFWPAEASAEGTTADTSTEGEGSTTDNSTEAGTTEATAGDTTGSEDVAQEALSGYESKITIGYTTTYQGLKKAIDYINHSTNHMSLGAVNVTFDSSTGNLMGALTINMYSLSGSEINKEYLPPFIDGNTGRDNIFGSAE